MCDQFGLFLLSVWNYETNKYVLVNEENTKYWDLADGEIKSLKEEFNLDISETASVPLLSQVGLKPVIILIVLLYIWSLFKGKKTNRKTKMLKRHDFKL